MVVVGIGAIVPIDLTGMPVKRLVVDVLVMILTFINTFYL